MAGLQGASCRGALGHEPPCRQGRAVPTHAEGPGNTTCSGVGFTDKRSSSPGFSSRQLNDLGDPRAPCLAHSRFPDTLANAICIIISTSARDLHSTGGGALFSVSSTKQ